MGAANVIPGVSGGTIAFISGIYEEFIDSLKSFNLTALKLLFTGKLWKFLDHINFKFLLVLFLGVGTSLVTLGKLLKYLLKDETSISTLLVTSFFFGLILASILFVVKLIKQWSLSTIISLLVGTAMAVSLSFLKPAQENSSLYYLFLCGIAAMSSMILPGLSGSFVLILMGNYQLIMLDSVTDPKEHLHILLPVAAGAVIGFILLSHGISFLLKKVYNQTIAILGGFILGSLLIVWPWKTPIYLKNAAGEVVIKHAENPDKAQKVIEGYDKFLPKFNISADWYAILFILLGIVIVVGLEKIGSKKQAAE